ncbi:hypothetical protein BDN72DRAFT_899502 [Pluteus cervinus]|uniref:Uncharacterized protein n=1 Tax=Pluteus cervinus TaxID=181527 RepID=A0ACD3AM33_9AGAR|nr:hypothetical protein BDN72DRAFT_899502 [Pluteus cervinus]
MSVTNFPAEVLEEVVSAMPWIDLPSLALVSREFRQLSQRKLFQYIFLEDRRLRDPSPNPHPRHILLKTILTENPIIAPYIRHLECTQTNRRRSSYSDDGPPILWMIDHGVLLGEILQLLEDSGIQSIAIMTMGHSLNWFNLHPVVQSGFLHLFENPVLTSLVLDGFILPSNISSGFTNLEALTISDSSWSTDRLLSIGPFDASGNTSNGETARLSSLDLAIELRALGLPAEHVGSLLELDFTRLSKLSLTLDTMPQSILSFTMQQSIPLLPTIRPFISGPNLEVLKIKCASDEILIDLSPTVSLQKLVIECCISQQGDDCSWIDFLLSSLPTTSPMQMFTLNIFVPPLLPLSSDPSDPVDTQSWRSLSQILARSHERLPRIKQIGVCITISTLTMKTQDEVDQVKEKVRDCFAWGSDSVLGLDFIVI